MKTYYYNSIARGYFDALTGVWASEVTVNKDVDEGAAVFVGNFDHCYRVLPPDIENARLVAAAANGPDEGATKPSNPKDAIGSRKLDLGLVPDSLVVGAAVALTDGALKYGRYNWRVAGVRASIYHAACRRHLAKWWNGEDCETVIGDDGEPVPGVGHLSAVAACVAILLDAAAYDKLNDDRPPSPDRHVLGKVIDALENNVAHLRELHKDKSPRQWSIADTGAA